MVRKWNKGICVLLLFCIMLSAVPVLIGTGYTYLCEDDYTFEAGANDLAEQHGSYVVGAAHSVKNALKTGEGVFFALYLQHLIVPYTRWGLPGLHACMILIMLLFLAALYYLLRSLTESAAAALGLMLTCIYSCLALGGWNNVELFFWYTGALNYTLELCLSMLAVGTAIRYVRSYNPSKDRLYLAAACICGLLASGGSLEVTAPNCSWLLILLVMCTAEKTEKKWFYLPFVFALAGGLFNALQPGNFRQAGEGAVEGHSTFLDAARDSIMYWGRSTASLVHSPAFAILLILAFMITIIFSVKIRRKGMSLIWLALMLLAVFLTQYLTIYPVLMGYHSTDLYTLRTAAFYSIISRWTWLLYAVCIGQFVAEHIPLSRRIIAGVSVAAMLLLGGLKYPHIREELRTGFSSSVAADLRDGTMVRVYNVRQYILSCLELERGNMDKDVILYIGQSVSSRSMYGMGLLPDCGEFCNLSCAGLFDVRTVTVIYGAQ